MNLRNQLAAIEAKAAALKSRIAREEAAREARARKLRELPRLVGLTTVAELILALKRLSPASARKRRRLDPAIKAKMIAEASKEGANRREIAKKYGGNLNSLNVWVGRAKRKK